MFVFVETDCDLRFVTSNSSNFPGKTFDDFMGADILVDSSGARMSAADQVIEYLKGNRKDDVESGHIMITLGEMIVDKGSKAKDPFEVAKLMVFAFETRNAITIEDMRNQASAQLDEQLKAQKGSFDKADGINAALNADGTVGVYSY